MHRFISTFCFLLISSYCFAQQSIPDRIIGRIPDYNSTKIYQIQVGAFKINQNAENAIKKLKNNGIFPVTERYQDFTRVIVKGIKASQVNSYLNNFKKAGFNEVIIREDTSISISEKWEINSPESDYLSFEFNHDRNYIAVMNDEDLTTYFGSYDMPQHDIIDMEDLGRLKLTDNNDSGVELTFSPIDEPETETNLTAIKSEKYNDSLELDMFCRTWLVVDCTNTETIGCILFISNAGTYFITEPDGEINTMSKWRWYNDSKEEFEYSHNNWAAYGRAKITKLTVNSLELLDPGFLNIVSGYSNAGLNNKWVLIPVR